MSTLHLNANVPVIHQDHELHPLPRAIRIGDIPLSIQALLALQFMEQTTTVLWIAYDNREMQRLHETLLTLKKPEQAVYPFYPESEDPAVIGQHLQLLARLATDEPLIILTSPVALNTPLPIPSLAKERLRTVCTHETLPPATLAGWLNKNGYEFGVEVYAQGEAAQRGGIIDCWPAGSPRPVRIEFFGNQIESIRYFDDQSQCSIEKIEQIELPALTLSETHTQPLLDHLPADTLIINPPDPTTPASLIETPYEVYQTGLHAPSATHTPAQAEAARHAFVEHCCNQAQTGKIYHFYFETEGTSTRFQKLYAPLPGFDQLQLHLGVIHESAHHPTEQITIITESDFYAYHTHRSAHARNARRFKKQERVNEAADIQPGDYVVHVEHGVGKYLGLVETKSGQTNMEVLSIEYAKGDKVYLPVTQAHLLTRYKSMGKQRPRLHTLGGRKWKNDRNHAEQGARDLAVQLLETQAARQAQRGIPSQPDTAQQAEFEAAFPYTETEDQLTATAQLKADMEKPQPMDRLLCGDVGFGKTEVAMRCAFKAVQEGRQVAVLVPTTVLAQQHCDSFLERMAAFPISIDMVCRFRTRKQQNETLARTLRGEVDILIGTHRILSGDVRFKNLGLLIIDEEQRFGVTAKEKLKWLRREIDIITMSATPIPRTLYMSLTGVRDLATIKTAPQERQPVETHVIPYDEPIIIHAIEREIQRGGQVFYLHNRVKTIHHVENRLRALLPDIRIAIAHGQMGETELSEIMHAFVEGRFDVLLCTTIIESGVDIPNCNTLFVENAERFGLSDLYQLRGRVGRSSRKAFAYFMLTQGGDLIDAARDRMNAIQRYTGLGSGFRLAMRDLEMRGAGNLLGANQSGHISNIGFDLYCQLLRRTIAQMQGKTPPPLMDVAVRIDFLNFSPASGALKNGAFIPYEYVEDENLRLRLYQRISALAEKKEITLIKKEITDRFGSLPAPVHRLLLIAHLRIIAAKKDIIAITVRDDQVMLNTEKGFRTQAGQHPRLAATSPTERLKELIQLL